MGFETLLPIGASLLGSAMSSNAAENAADTQAGASNAATAEQRRQYEQTRQDQLNQYDQTRQDQAPYRDAGAQSLAQLMQGSAPNGEFNNTYQRGAFQADPGYQFRQQQGEQGINRAASARGGLYSGATLKALANFNSNLASQEYGNWDTRQNNAFNQFNSNRDFKRNNLASLAGIGQTATNAIGNAGQNAFGTIAQAGQNSTNQIGQNMQNAGEARASGYIGSSNAFGNGIKSIYNDYKQNQYLNNNQAFNGSLNGVMGVYGD